MGPVNWLAVVLAAMLAVAVGLVWNGPLFGTGRQLLGGPEAQSRTSGYLLTLVVMALAAIMLGHTFARIGPDVLHAKPWLYFMLSGGVALFFVAPALWLTHLRLGSALRPRLVDAAFWIVAYLAMGLVFWALG